MLLLTSLAFGLMPALRGSRTEIAPSLLERGATGMNTGRVSAASSCFVVIQVALSLLLLVGAGLFVRTLRNLQNEGPGFPNRTPPHLLR